MARVLILGGTGDAAQLAAKAAAIPGVEIITSLAGRTSQPSPISGKVRVGSFGGEAGLTEYLQTENIYLLIDATHPFADVISKNAAAACRNCGTKHVRLNRPGWEKVAGDRWVEVESVEAAAAVLPNLAKRVFLTIGRQHLGYFAQVADIWFLMRAIDPPAVDAVVPPGLLLLERGPFTVEAEKKLLISYEIDTLVSKNSGGDATYAKILAARSLGVQVVMVKRKPTPASEQVSDVESALAWLVGNL